METPMIEELISYSTAEFEKTISAEDNPVYTKIDVSQVYFPPGEYRLIAGELKRVIDRPTAVTPRG